MTGKEPIQIIIDGMPDTITVVNMPRPATDYFAIGFRLAAGATLFAGVCVTFVSMVYYLINLSKGWF